MNVALSRFLNWAVYTDRPPAFAVISVAAVAAAAALLADVALHMLPPSVVAWGLLGAGVVGATLAAGARAGAVALLISLAAAGVISARSGLADPPFGLPGAAALCVCAALAVPLAHRLRRRLIRLRRESAEVRRAIEALAYTERRFDLAQQAGGVGVIDWDIVSGACWFSESVRRNFGYGPDAPLTQETIRAAIHPEDREALDLRLRHAVTEGSGYSVEYRVVHPNGEVRWLAGQAEVLTDEDGRPTRMIAVSRDITERRLYEQRLRESETQFRGVFEAPLLGFAVSDLAVGGALDVNDRFLEIVGVTRAQFDRGEWDWRSVTPPEHLAKDERATAQILATGRADPYEKEYVRPDGSRAPVLVYAAALQGSPGKMVIGVQCISERRAADLALRESEARFRLVADSAPVLMWVSEPGARFVFVNRAYVQFAGVPYEQALAGDWTARVHADDLARVQAAQAAGMASASPFVIEGRFQRADGEWRWLRALAQPRQGPQGEHAGYVGVGVDVTDAKQAEADLKRINELLEERVAAALAEKADAEAALFRARKMEAVGQLTGGVAHDFNNLLTVVIGALDMILKHPDDAAKRRRLGEAALAAARRGERLTHQLLAFSRRQALRPEICDVNALIRDGEPLIRRAVDEATAFAVRLSEGPAVARVDTAQFEAALLNLVVNARDATPAGGQIAVETGRRSVAAGEVPDLAPGDYVVVRVRDTGAGMCSEVLSKAFEPFFTTKPAGKGTGLGLSQVYGFARQSGGAVHVESSLGAGATVSLYLPASEAAEEPARAPFRPLDAPRRVLRVLLVEDDPSVAAIAETMLVELGHAVMRADHAEAALKVLRTERPIDLLLTDVIMPGGVNGVELARQAAVLRPDLAVVLSSGYAGEAVDAALADAPWPFLKKPYAASELAAMLQVQACPQAPEPA